MFPAVEGRGRFEVNARAIPTRALLCPAVPAAHGADFGKSRKKVSRTAVLSMFFLAIRRMALYIFSGLDFR